MPPHIIEQVARAIAGELDAAADSTDRNELWEKLPVETQQWALRIAERAVEAYIAAVAGRRLVTDDSP